MRTITAAQLDLLTRNDVQPFLLISIGPNLNTDYLRYTSLPYDFTYESNLYLCDSNIVNLDPPRISDTIDKESYTLTFSDPEYNLRPFFEGGSGRLLGTEMSILGGFVNSTDTLLHGTSPGAIFDDYFTIYKGKIDSANYTTTEETVLLIVEGASPMGPLDLTRTIITSHEYIRRKYPSENCYIKLFEGSAQATIEWGKNQ